MWPSGHEDRRKCNCIRMNVSSPFRQSRRTLPIPPCARKLQQIRQLTPCAYGGDNDWMGYLLRLRTILLPFDANDRSCVVHLPRDAADQQVHAKLSLYLLPRTGVPLPHVYDKENVSIALQLLQICSYAGAKAEHLLSLAEYLATHALCCDG